MKTIFISLLILIFPPSVYGQKDSLDFFFNEFNASLNKTTLPDGIFKQELGFGIGAYRSMMNQKKVNLIFGFEYNLNRQFLNHTYEGHFASATNVQYAIHNWSIPLNVRYNVGERIRFFIETGIFLDFILSSKRKGTMHSYWSDQNGNIVYKEFPFNEKAGLSSLNYGFFGGLGMRIPIQKKELAIKIDYKFGLNNLSSMNNIYTNYLRVVFGLKIR